MYGRCERRRRDGSVPVGRFGAIGSADGRRDRSLGKGILPSAEHAWKSKLGFFSDFVSEQKKIEIKIMFKTLKISDGLKGSKGLLTNFRKIPKYFLKLFGQFLRKILTFEFYEFTNKNFTN